MQNVTAEEVKNAMIAANITHVNNRECSICNFMTYYSRIGENIYFHPRCDCVTYASPPEQRSWDEMADWINRQPKLQIRNELRKSFGLSEEPKEGAA